MNKNIKRYKEEIKEVKQLFRTGDHLKAAKLHLDSTNRLKKAIDNSIPDLKFNVKAFSL